MSCILVKQKATDSKIKGSLHLANKNDKQKFERYDTLRLQSQKPTLGSSATSHHSSKKEREPYYIHIEAPQLHTIAPKREREPHCIHIEAPQLHTTAPKKSASRVVTAKSSLFSKLLVVSQTYFRLTSPVFRECFQITIRKFPQQT